MPINEKWTVPNQRRQKPCGAPYSPRWSPLQPPLPPGRRRYGSRVALSQFPIVYERARAICSMATAPWHAHTRARIIHNIIMYIVYCGEPDRHFSYFLPVCILLLYTSTLHEIITNMLYIYLCAAVWKNVFNIVWIQNVCRFFFFISEYNITQ